MTNYNIQNDKFETLVDHFRGYIKPTIWYYEKETRIVIRLISEVYDLINDNCCYKIIMRFDDRVYQSISVMFGPEFLDYNEIDSEYKSIKDFIFDTSKAEYSKYREQIEMRLLKKA